MLDLAGSYLMDGQGQGLAPDVAIQLHPDFRREALGIPEPGKNDAGREDHGRGHHWTRQRAPAHLIHAGY